METPSLSRSRSSAKVTATCIFVTVGAGIVIIAVAWFYPDRASYSPWNGALAEGGSLAIWLLSAWTEPEFYTSALAGTGLLFGALFANYLQVLGSRGQGLGLACGSGLWPWTVTSSTIGLVLSNIAWGWTLRVTGLWQPTFVSVASIAPTVVLAYGAGWRPALTGAVLSTLLVVPLAIAATHLFCRPLGLPLVVGVTGGMAAGAFLSFAVCRILPWLPALPAPKDGEEAPETQDCGPSWVARRMLADFSEAQFFGNEWASAGLILGVLLALLLAPGVPVYGSGQILAVLAGQVIAAGVGMALWYRKWVQRGFYPTFVPIASVVPAAVLTLDGSAYSIIGSAVLGALVGPPLAAAISAPLPAGFHPVIGNVASMAISTAVIVPALGLIHSASSL